MLALGFRGTGAQWRHYQATVWRAGRDHGAAGRVRCTASSGSISPAPTRSAGIRPSSRRSSSSARFLSGFATVLLLIIPLRRLLRLERYITGRHLDVLGRLLLTSSLFIAYAYIMDAFIDVLRRPTPPTRQCSSSACSAAMPPSTGHDRRSTCCCRNFCGSRRLRLNQPLVLADLPAHHHRHVVRAVQIVVRACTAQTCPPPGESYTATFWDWLTMAGTVGLFLTGILLLIRIVPVIALAEMRDLLRKQQ